MNRSIFRTAPFIALVLGLSILSPLPLQSLLPSAHAVVQSGPSAWSPFGPNVRNLLITVYSDFQTMFNAFASGELDITDWPVQPSDIPGFSSNPDFYMTSPTSEFGIFHLDFNHHNSFLGVAQQSPRTTGTPSLTVTGTATGCSLGFGRLIINLKNLEEGNTLVLDPLNKVKVVGPVSVAPVKDDPTGGTVTDGTYIVPSPTTCMLAGDYTVSTTVYSGSASVFVDSNQIVTASFSVNYNSPSPLKPTPAGVEARRAVAHLLDKVNFPNAGSVQGLADYVDIQAPPSQGLSVGGAANSKLPTSILQEDCTGNNPSNSANPHPWVSLCGPVSAYNLQSDTLSGCEVWWGADGCAAGADKGYSGPADIQAACDHFVRAGFTMINGDCVALAGFASGSGPPSCASQTAYTCPRLVSPAGPNQQTIMYIRTHLPRKAFGTIIADSLNFLFGTPNHQTNNAVTTCLVNYGFLSPGQGCAPAYYGITQIFDIVFSIVPSLDDYGIYSGGFLLGATPDHLYSVYHSAFAGALCGGVAEEFPGDYPFYCNPVYDAQAAAGEFSSSLPEANGFFGNAAVTAHRTVMTIPVYSLVSQFVALNGWNFQPGPQSSLVNVLGHGFQLGYWSLMNMRQVPGYDPCAPPDRPPNCSAFVPGGGNPQLIRRGFSQDVHKLSPFHALTVWDFEVLSQVFDSMLVVNPLTGGTGQQIIDWMTVSHSSSFSATEVSCVGTRCVTGTTTQKWFLRNDLRWHDGRPVKPDDIVYTIIAYRDVPSANLQPNVATVSSATVCGRNCVQVKLQHQSPFYELNIGALPIIPKDIWAPVCGDPPSPASLCGSPDFDPMAQGIYMGSGPWVCIGPGPDATIQTADDTIGGSCTTPSGGTPGSGTQDVTLGGTILLTANDNYHRGPTHLQGSSLQQLSWADRNNDGVNSILDIADASLHFGAPDPYWDHPVFGAFDGTVDLGEVATVAFYFDHGITKPHPPSSLIGLDPVLDPYRSDLTQNGGPVIYYEGGRRTGTGQLTIKLVALSGTLNPSAFTASLTTEAGVPVGSATGSPGGTSVVLLQFSGINPGRYQLRITFNGAAQPFTTIRLIL